MVAAVWQASPYSDVAFCIFYDNTPASLANTIYPTSEVNVFSSVPVYANVFRLVKSGGKIVVERERSQ